MALSPNVSILRQIISELRHGLPCGNFKENLMMSYVIGQFRKFDTTDEQLCKAKEEMKAMAQTYLCYLKSSRMQSAIQEEFHGKGERSIEDTAKLVGFKLPHDPK